MKIATGFAALAFASLPAGASAQALTAQAPAAAPAPAVAAPSESAPFSATAGRLIFDRNCDGLTFDTLPGNSACAARVARGETGPSIKVAFTSLQASRSPATIAAAIAQLERAVAAENHPAALYAAGSLLTTGELFFPDYARGIPHLERAAAGGNAAAADLLAGFVLEGRGVAQDIPRAVALYEAAAAGGMNGAASRLAQLYLSDRHIPRDVARARRILEAAAAVNARGGRETLLLLDREGIMTNYQLHPDADPAKIAVRTYPTTANPEIPPSFGFTDELRRVHYSSLSDPAILARLERDHASLPTPWLYEIARRTALVSPERGLGWLMLARLRMSYDAMRCADPQAREGPGAWDMLVRPDFYSILTHATPEQMRAARLFALEREAALPAGTRPWWVCHAGMSGFAAASDGPPPLRLVPESEWPAIRARLRTEMSSTPTAPAGNPQP
jgi:TPR repeat protein